MDYAQYLAAVRRRWPVMLASIVVICGAVIVHHFLTPRFSQYKATARILMSPTSQIAGDDLAQLGLSDSVMFEVFRTVYSDVLATADPEQARERFIRFRQDIRCEAVGGGGGQRSNIVLISAVGDTSERAVRAANALAEKVQEAAAASSLDLYRTQKGSTSDALEEARRNLEARLKELRDFKEANKDRILPLDFSQAQAQVNMLTRDVEDAQSSVQEYQRRARALRETLGRRSQRESYDVDAVPSSAVIDRLQAQLATQEVELMNLKMRYTEDHPRVKETRQMIENTKARLNAEVNKTFKLENAPASLEYQFITGDISRYEAERMAAEARRRALEGLLRRARTELADVPARELKLAELNSRVAEAQKRYDAIAERQFQSDYAIAVLEKQRQLEVPVFGSLFNAAYASETAASKLAKLRFKLPIAFLISIIVGLGIVLFLEGLDTSIRDVDQVEDRYQLPVLGVVPALKEASLKGGSTLVLRDSPDTPFAESYRIMRANFLALARQAQVRSVMITSTLPGEGKTTTAANFAASLAEGHKRVVLIDADMRNPSLHRAFGVRKEPGLSNYLAGEASLADILFPTSVENLVLISAGSIPDNPARLLTGPRMKELLEQLEAEADYVVIDTPPAVAFSDAMELGSIADSMIVVVGAGSRLESAHFRARTQLANVQAVIVGTVLNRVQPADVDSYRYSARYYPRMDGRGKLPGPKEEPAALPDGNS
jgi:capsular exopolysaccharide synthesis family protein